MAYSQEAQGSSQQLPPRKFAFRNDPVLGVHHVSDELQQLLVSKPFLRLKNLRQLGVTHRVRSTHFSRDGGTVCNGTVQIYAAAEHSRYAHSIAVGVLARKLGKEVSNRLLADEDAAAGEDVVLSANAHDSSCSYGTAFMASSCRATKQELLQLELAGFAHDLGHGPWSHLWEKYLHSVDSGKDWSHEDMSEKLLEAAVKETVEECSLPADHFLCCPENLAAVKAMIRGDSSAVEAPKKWLYSIVCNDRSGLDVDKLEYLLRDQHMCFGMHSPGRFNTLSQLETLFRHARIVAVRDPDSTGEGEIVTDIAFENTREQELVRLVDDIFQTREVIALEERMLHLLHSVPQGACDWIVKSRDPMKFLQLDDALFDDLAQKKTLHSAVRMVEGTGGWTSVGSPWIVPEALLSSRSASLVQKQIETGVVPRVAEEAALQGAPGLLQRLKVRMAKIGDGAKKGATRAVQRTPFFYGEGPLPVVEWFDAASLRGVYGLRTDGTTPCSLVYCHLQCWHDTEGPNSSCQLISDPSQHSAVHLLLHKSFDTLWSSWVNEQMRALARSPADNVAAGAQSVGVGALSGDDETPKGRKNGVFDCKTTRNGMHAKSDYGGLQERLRGEAATGVVPVDTPPRKRAREEDCVRGNTPAKMRAAPAAVCESKGIKSMEVVLDTDEEDGEDEESHGGVLTQPGISML